MKTDPVVVKICGITNLPDALAATEAGANALGFVFYAQSPRHVTPDQARAVIQRLPSQVVKVGVFVNAVAAEVMATIEQCGLNVAQFHGDETPEYCQQFGIMTMKAFRVTGPEIIDQCSAFAADALLLDSYDPGRLGGTGETFNWDLVSKVRTIGRPVFLAGGLTPENVAEAIRRVQPYGVDVSSGVEVEPGRKDHAKVRRFVAAAKGRQIRLEG